MNNQLRLLAPGYFEGKGNLTKEELANAIGKDFTDWSETTINIRISDLKRAGILHSLSRGVYTINLKSNYRPEISSKLKKLNGLLKKQFPYAKFCIWDTKWLNEFMRHQPVHFYLVAEVEKDALESAFHALSEFYPKIFLNPGATVFERYVSISENPLIVKQLVSESPVQLAQNIDIPKIEKLLVDMLIDKDLFGAQQNEIDFMYRTVFEKYNLNPGMMKRYAQRRNRKEELLTLLYKTSANNG